MKHAAIVLVLSLLLGWSPSAQTARPAPQAPDKPKLVVFISIDQMRGDYVDRFRHQWTKGLHRLVTEGAWFRQTDYPYYNTVTCAGHASMSTGTVPAVHGMVLNQWWERNNSRLVACTDDEDVKLITYGIPLKGIGNSAKYLMSNTLADEMRLQGFPSPRVVSISLKARSAINLGGHKPDAVIWLDEADGEWATSSAFAKEPAPFFADYIKKHPLKGEMGRIWERSLPKERYLYEYSSQDRRRIALVTKEFPHTVKGTGEEVGGAFTDAWESSPFSDEYLNALAMTSIDALKMGRGAATDFLSISFSALDKVGHDFGPDSHETQDVLIHLDTQLGLLLDKLDRDVGKGNYVVGLTSDHGVAPVPERIKAQGFDAGRIDTAAVGRAIDVVLARELGAATYRTRVIYNDVYFNEGVYLKLTQNPKAMESVLDTIRKTPGVWRVYRKEELSATDPLTRAPAFSHYEGRSGDIKMLSRAYWITSTSTTTHGTGHRYDTRVPMMLFGYGIKKGEYLDQAAPIDLAPTLAYLTGVTLPDAMGRLLREALTHQ
ncbi:MAG TPA: alkaline phosphatase family protein [Vicinamibacterales bacterium]|jgi:predicted AlkP superfamily pyrophosphatase or phosphodiesterase